jgi:hypothetical protein
MKKYVAASLCMFVVAACAMGGSKKSAMVAAPPTASETGGQPAGAQPDMSGMTPKQQVDALYAQVEQERERMQLPEAQLEPGAQSMPMSEPVRTPQTDNTCKPAPSDTCNTSCTLSGSICKNKDRICELAKDLGDDDSLGKCVKATKTCKTAADKCCNCML